MQRPNFRYPANSAGPPPRPGGFRSPPPGFVSRQGGMQSPPWGFAGAPPSPFGPRFGQYCGSPNTPQGDFRGSSSSFNRSGGGGKPRHYGFSPDQHTPRRSFENRRGNSPRHSPFQSPSPRYSGYQVLQVNLYQIMLAVTFTSCNSVHALIRPMLQSNFTSSAFNL